MESYLGTLLIFGGNYAIRDYLMCNGQIQSISTNAALYAILGTTYGGDGQQTFKLPDLRGRAPIHFGQGPGLSDYALGEVGGTETTTLLTANMPAHNHIIYANHKEGDSAEPSANYLAQGPSGVTVYTNVAPDTQLAANSVSTVGGSAPFNNLQPYLCLNYLITVYGIYPSRN